ncbi:MAG: hypothetical protein WC006_07750 [Bacilli bacterium]
MLKINRLKINIYTKDDLIFCFDETFNKKINIIGSIENTKGKSSSLQGLYYCLGIEELLGGKKEKPLSPLFKDEIKDENNEKHPVDYASFYLEIMNNNKEILTINRSSNNKFKDSNLISVSYSNLDDFEKNKAKKIDLFLHRKGSASTKNGFHYFLEEFLSINLPNVPNYNAEETKLYLQLYFSAFFIEQKLGWGGYFQNIPYYGIVDPKRRIIEYILNLTNADNTRKKEDLKIVLKDLKKEINFVLLKINELLIDYEYEIVGLNELIEKPYSKEWKNNVYINIIYNNSKMNLEEYYNYLKNTLKNYEVKRIYIKDHLPKIQQDIINNQNMEIENRKKIIELNEKISLTESEINAMTQTIDSLLNEVNDLKDILALKKLGSTIDINSLSNTCPTCKQNISSSLILSSDKNEWMSIEENLTHLNSQIKILNYSNEIRKRELQEYNKSLLIFKNNLISTQKLLKSQIDDIYRPSDEVSFSFIREKFELEKNIDTVQNIITSKIPNYYDNLDILYKKYSDINEEIISLQKCIDTENDNIKISSFTKTYREILKELNFSSVSLESISIDNNSLFPSSSNYDLRFDCSASDNIRSIWAYYYSLMAVSKKYCKEAHHLFINVFDEPIQQGIDRKDFYILLKNYLKNINDMQLILGMTFSTKELESENNTFKELDIKVIINENLLFKKVE